jgi:hypothetical protein
VALDDIGVEVRESLWGRVLHVALVVRGTRFAFLQLKYGITNAFCRLKLGLELEGGDEGVIVGE